MRLLLMPKTEDSGDEDSSGDDAGDGRAEFQTQLANY
jgi:hypothetical protein